MSTRGRGNRKCPKRVLFRKFVDQDRTTDESVLGHKMSICLTVSYVYRFSSYSNPDVLDFIEFSIIQIWYYRS